VHALPSLHEVPLVTCTQVPPVPHVWHVAQLTVGQVPPQPSEPPHLPLQLGTQHDPLWQVPPGQ
jgi:hypothetical protein